LLSRARLSLAPKSLSVAVAVIVALTSAALAYTLDLWPRVESDSIDARFALRGATPSSDVVVVAIDDKTFSELQLQWPFRRALHAQVIDRLHADRAKAIVYDIQFTEPTDPRDDLALYGAAGRAGNVVFATTEVDRAGHADVLGGEANLRAIHAVAGASNLPADGGGVIRRYPYSLFGLPSLAVAAARAAGHPISGTRFRGGRAWIDFRGPPGSITTESFSDVLHGKVLPQAFAGKVVVVGVSAPTLQDVHQTSTASTNPMSGPELQANAIWTAIHGDPLQEGPSWLALLAIAVASAVAPLASLRFRVLVSGLLALAFAAAYTVVVQIAFDSGTLLVLTYPLAACALGAIAMLAASYVAAFIERNAFSRQLHESQVELIERLAQAVESRDAETGAHIHRIGVLCEGLALGLGWTAADAETIRYASAMHDIGKIGIPDRVLLKPGKLDAQEWEIVRAHPTRGGEILANSSNPLVQMAEEIARSHHERWDGSGYPDGLAGEQIPMAARICAVCDVYDALLSRRSYKDSWSLQDALAEISRESGSHFDPRVVAAFLDLAPRLSEELVPPALTDAPAPTVRPVSA
jgi:CHASE2 domain-containing sensor protein